jgi:hypothetical protein
MNDLSNYDLNRLVRWNKILAKAKDPLIPGTLAALTKLMPDTTRLDCIKMCKQGFMGLVENNSATGMTKAYFAKMDSVNMEMYQPMGKRDADSYKKKISIELANGATLHRLTDTVQWTPKAKTKVKVYIGSTFGML